MKAIIVGGGRVGIETAKLLSRENQDVVIIEKKPETVEMINNSLDVMTIRGNGASARVLAEAGVREADILIAATEVDEINIIACMMAKRFGVKKTVARIRNREYTDGAQILSGEQLGIDVIIDPERVAALEIAKLIKNPSVSKVEYFADGKVQMLVFKVDADSEVVGKPLSSLNISQSLVIAAIARESGEVIIPGGSDRLEPNDHVYVVGKRGVLAEIGWMVKKKEDRLRNVMILGCGKIGLQLAKMLEKHRSYGLSIKVIEKEQERCRQIADSLSNTLVLCGDATDLTLLKEEEISEVDALVAVTGDDENNILIGLVAKKLGAKRAIVEISRPDYDSIVKSLGIDWAVNPQILTAGEILRLVHKSDVLSVTILEQEKAEMVELFVSPKARVANRYLSEVKLPKGMLVGAIVRQNHVIVPKGDDRVLPGDRVIVFTLPETAPLVDRYFA